MQQRFTVRTEPRAFTDITARVRTFAQSSRVQSGVCHVFLRHTSASLLLCENADPAVRRDLEHFMQGLVPERTDLYEHRDEGLDDMPAHIRMMLAGATLSVPIGDGELLLGLWQGVYIWEHRDTAHQREVVLTVLPC